MDKPRLIAILTDSFLPDRLPVTNMTIAGSAKGKEQNDRLGSIYKA